MKRCDFWIPSACGIVINEKLVLRMSAATWTEMMLKGNADARSKRIVVKCAVTRPFRFLSLIPAFLQDSIRCDGAKNNNGDADSADDAENSRGISVQDLFGLRYVGYLGFCCRYWTWGRACGLGLKENSCVSCILGVLSESGRELRLLKQKGR